MGQRFMIVHIGVGEEIIGARVERFEAEKRAELTDLCGEFAHADFRVGLKN